MARAGLIRSPELPSKCLGAGVLHHCRSSSQCPGDYAAGLHTYPRTLESGDAVIPSTVHLRIARPSRDLAAAERFWTQGLGLHVLWRMPPGSDHALLMVGWPAAAWHLELIADPQVVPAPTEEDLLVLYVDKPVPEPLIHRICQAGGRQVQSRNPYWDDWGVTIQDPDGYRLVLCRRQWANG